MGISAAVRSGVAKADDLPLFTQSGPTTGTIPPGTVTQARAFSEVLSLEMATIYLFCLCRD